MTLPIFHVGRSWTGHHLEDECPCPKAPCGLVATDAIDPTCVQHTLNAAKTMRQTHLASQCPRETSIHETPFGQLRRVVGPGFSTSDAPSPVSYELCCPGCGRWGEIDDDQLHGRVSVDHAVDGCAGGYHETHDFAAHLP